MFACLYVAAGWEKRWLKSDWKKDEGTAGDWELTAGEWYAVVHISSAPPCDSSMRTVTSNWPQLASKQSYMASNFLLPCCLGLAISKPTKVSKPPQMPASLPSHPSCRRPSPTKTRLSSCRQALPLPVLMGTLMAKQKGTFAQLQAYARLYIL